MFGDILASPFFWVLTVGCIAACIYAKRNVAVGIITGIFAPLIIIPIYIIAALAINVPHFLVRKMFPEIFVALKSLSTVWSTVILLVTDPGHLAALFTCAYGASWSKGGRLSCLWLGQEASAPIC